MITTYLASQFKRRIILCGGQDCLGTPRKLVPQRHLARTQFWQATTPRYERFDLLTLSLYPLQDPHGSHGVNSRIQAAFPEEDDVLLNCLRIQSLEFGGVVRSRYKMTGVVEAMFSHTGVHGCRKETRRKVEPRMKTSGCSNHTHLTTMSASSTNSLILASSATSRAIASTLGRPRM